MCEAKINASSHIPWLQNSNLLIFIHPPSCPSLKPAWCYTLHLWTLFPHSFNLSWSSDCWIGFTLGWDGMNRSDAPSLMSRLRSTIQTLGNTTEGGFRLLGLKLVFECHSFKGIFRVYEEALLWGGGLTEHTQSVSASQRSHQSFTSTNMQNYLLKSRSLWFQSCGEHFLVLMSHVRCWQRPCSRTNIHPECKRK